MCTTVKRVENLRPDLITVNGAAAACDKVLTWGTDTGHTEYPPR